MIANDSKRLTKTNVRCILQIIRDGNRPRAGRTWPERTDIMADTTIKTADKQQINLRLAPETADKFKQFCEENGVNQAQGFDHLIQVLEINEAKKTVPDHATDIEDYETLTKALNTAFLKAIQDSANAKLKALEECRTELESKDQKIDSRDKTIADLQARLTASETAQKTAEATLQSALQSAAQADKEAQTAREQAETAQALVAEKDRTIVTLTEKLKAAEDKADGYDTLKTDAEQAKSALKEEQKAHAADVKALQAEMDQRVKDTEKDAEIARLTARNEADKQIAGLQARVEMLIARIKELTEQGKAPESPSVD